MQSGNPEGVIRLINAGAHPDEIRNEQGFCALMMCLPGDVAHVASRLLKAGANPNVPPPPSQDKTYLGHILECAGAGYSQPMLQAFLVAGADPDMPLHVVEGPRPLHFAASRALAGPAALLAAHGANPFERDEQGKTAIDHLLGLPDFQKALLLGAIFPPPLSPDRLETLLACLPQEEHELLSWLEEAWGGPSS